MSLASELDGVRVELAGAAPEFMLDTCDLIAMSSTAAGAGHTIADQVLASGVSCSYEQISGGLQVEVDGVTRTTTHRIKIAGVNAALLIDQHYKIKVLARSPNPQLIFEQPIREVSSFTPFVVVQAILTQGFRHPGSR